MKKTCSYLSIAMNLMICLLLVFNLAIFHIDIKRYSSFVEYDATTYVSYNKKEVLEEVVVVEKEIEKTETESNQSSPEISRKDEPKEVIEVSESEDQEESSSKEPTETILETYQGVLSGYGPDCLGCTSNKTASGYYIGEGNIYFNDPTYGTVRIVSGDSKYPFGSIVRISNTTISTEPILAIVLDRGGSIGIDKKIQFDLLFATERDASPLGLNYNVTFEILRLGYA